MDPTDLPLKPWHAKWCPAVLPYVSETRCECGGAEAHWERKRAERVQRQKRPS